MNSYLNINSSHLIKSDGGGKYKICLGWNLLLIKLTKLMTNICERTGEVFMIIFNLQWWEYGTFKRINVATSFMRPGISIALLIRRWPLPSNLQFILVFRFVCVNAAFALPYSAKKKKKTFAFPCSSSAREGNSK